MLLRPSRKGRYRVDSEVVRAYLAGTIAGALLTAVAVWILSGFGEPLADAARVPLLVAGAVFVWLVKEGPLGPYVRLPEARRQIPAEVFGGSLPRGAWRFGFELGTGVRTYVPATAPYVLALAVLLLRPSLGAALLTGLGFGVGRAVPVMVSVVTAERLQFTLDFARGIKKFPQTAGAVLVLAGALSLV